MNDWEIEKLELTKVGLDEFVGKVDCANCPLSELCLSNRRVWNKSICDVMDDKIDEIYKKLDMEEI